MNSGSGRPVPAARRKRGLSPARRERIAGVLLPLLTFLFIILVWQVISVQFQLPVWLLPSPQRVAAAGYEWADQLPRHTFVTLYETMIGFVISVAFAVPMAMLIGLSTFLRRTIYPLLILLQSVPKVAVAPLLLIWLGHGVAPKIGVVILVCFFPIVVSATSGIEKTPQSLLDLAKTCKATRLQIFMKMQLPYSVPYLFVGLKVAITLALIGAVIGEFVGANEGLGYLILISTTQVNTSLAFAAMGILTTVSILLYYIVEGIEAISIPWASRVKL